MTASDKLVGLVKAGALGDKQQFRKVVETIIADEKLKKHFIVAERLEQELEKFSNQNTQKIVKKFIDIKPNAVESKLESLANEKMPTIGFSDLVFSNHIQDSLFELIEEQNRADILKSYGIAPRNRVLLVGPPGNGKTSIAEALADALMVPLLVVRYDSVIGSYLGETASRLRQIIDYASTKQCVLFFDEFETLGKERGDSHDSGEIKRIVSSLLMLIDSIPSHVIIVGATNHDELLDRAVWRRFQIRVTVPKPTRAQIETLLMKFENRYNIKFDYAYETLSKKLYGVSFSEVEEFCRAVMRKYILNSPNSNMRNIVSLTLKNWPAHNTTNE